MHSLLENYLSEVAAHLSALPVKRRTEELREIQSHLENAVTVNRELGQFEEEAAQNTVAQFGTPTDLGGHLVWAWRRERTLNRKDLWRAAGTATLTLCLLSFLMDQRFFDLFLDSLFPHTFLIYLGKHPGYGMDFTQAIFLVNFGLAGLMSGLLFPKRASEGVCLGLILFWIGWAADCGGMSRALFGMDRAEWIFSAIIAAWLGSRWRTERTKRVRLARG